MVTLCYPIPTKTIRHRIELYNGEFTPDNSKAGDYIDYTKIRRDRIGWYYLPTTATIHSINVEETLDGSASGSLSTRSDHFWMFGASIIKKYADAMFFNDVSMYIQNVNSQVIVNVQAYDSGWAARTGSITVTGTSPTGASQTDTISNVSNVNGSYVTPRVFRTVTSITASNLSYCVLSAYAQTAKPYVKREIRIWIDTNSDNVYGLIFGGKYKLIDRRWERVRDVYTLDLIGYADDQINTEYIAGMRAEYRCAHYNKTGEKGTCDISTTGTYAPSIWRKENFCYIGDFHTHHPNGAVVSISEGYSRCPDYTPGDEVLPFDGYTYDPEYAPLPLGVDPDIGIPPRADYMPFPTDPLRAIEAIERMSNSVEKGKGVSAPWTLACRTQFTTSSAFDASTTAIPFKFMPGSATLGYRFAQGDFIRIDKEWMKIVSLSSSTINVERAQLQSVAASHSANVPIYFPTAARAVSNLVSATDSLYLEPDIKGTIYQTGKSIAETSVLYMLNREYMYWVDAYKRIHITELDLENAGSTAFEIRERDILDTPEPTVRVSEPTNAVSAWVTFADGDEAYCTLSASELSTTTYSSPFYRADLSEQLFGLKWEELSNKQLNAVGTLEGYNSFEVFAKNYLKTHMFPKVVQIVTIDSFVPDELSEADNVASGYPTFIPTDFHFNYVCLLGTKVKCPDFSKTRDDATGKYPVSDFILTGIKTTICGNSNFQTRLRLSKLTTASDYL